MRHLKLGLKSAGLGILCTGLIYLGCVFGPAGCAKLVTFIEYAEQDIPIAEGIIQNITTIVAPGVSAELAAAGQITVGVFESICGGATAGTPALPNQPCQTGVVADYQAQCPPTAIGATPACQSLLDKAKALLTSVNSNIQAMITAAAKIPQTIAADVVTSIGLALSTIVAVSQMIPTTATASAVRAAAANANKPPKPGDLKNRYNKTIRNHFPGAVLP